tara:strand:+ start:7310 stop:7597 length:288 start_codon:yes stop_codon:yes gene_type:complete
MSIQRAEDYFLATDGKWYLALGCDEGCYEMSDCFIIGAFDSLGDAESAFANRSGVSGTGGSEIDDSGTVEPPPAKRLNAPGRLTGELSGGLIHCY